MVNKAERRQRRIENLASSMKVSGPTTTKVVRRPEMNMEIDTLRLDSVDPICDMMSAIF